MPVDRLPMEVTVEGVREALRGVVDPEVGVNVVDLGIVYGIRVEDGNVDIEMTMTTRACPLGEMLTEQAQALVRRHVPASRSVTVRLVWEPPWRPAMMSEAAKAQLGWAE